MHTGVHDGMANRVEGNYFVTEYLGSLETDVFEVGKDLLVHVYEMGERETICWPAEAAVLLLD